MAIRKFDLTVMVACLALLGYLGWHGFYGPRNFGYRDTLNTKVAALQTELAATVTERTRTDQRVALMRPELLDPDMLEELARQDLNFARPNQLILIQK